MALEAYQLWYNAWSLLNTQAIDSFLDSVGVLSFEAAEYIRFDVKAGLTISGRVDKHTGV